MLKKLLFVFLLFSGLTIYAADIFVDQSAPVGGDGSSWALAFQDIQSAVDVATDDDTIFIAEGIYKPENTIIFSIPLNIRGGYPAGGGVQDINANITQIQADFDSSNWLTTLLTFTTTLEASITGIRFFNCITAIKSSANLTIIQSRFEQMDKALSIASASNAFTIENSLFTNISDEIIVASGTIQNLDITNSTFQNSTRRALSGGVNLSNLTMTDCIIKGFDNDISIISIQNTTATFTNLLVENNLSTSNAIIFFRDSNVLVEESIFNNNSGEGIICFQGINSQLDIIDSNLTNNSSIGASPYPVFVMNDVKLTAQNCLFKIIMQRAHKQRQ